MGTHPMKMRIFQVDQVGKAPFRFLAESKELAVDHVWSLNQGIADDFPRCVGTPKQIGWTEDYLGLDLDDASTWR